MVVIVCFTKHDGFCLLILKIDSMFEDIVSNLLKEGFVDKLILKVITFFLLASVDSMEEFWKEAN